MTRAFIFMLVLLAAPLAAQGSRDNSDDELRQRLARMEAELANLRERIERQERGATDDELRKKTIVQVYGDIGLQYHMLFESQTETFNRPDFHLHIGVFGTAFEQDGQLIRYDARITTQTTDVNGKSVPTLSWQPLPGFGARPVVAFDRFLIEGELERTLRVTLGRFPSPYTGTELLFDDDYHFQGMAESVRFDRFLPASAHRFLPRLEIVAVQGYMAQNNLGLPSPTAESQPVYLGSQFRIDVAPLEQPAKDEDGRVTPEVTGLFEFRLVAGIHWFDGEEAIASNLGLGYLDGTTNVLADDGLVQSEFLVGEVYAEFIFLRAQRARVTAWFHGTFNFHAEPRGPGRNEKNEQAFDVGASWGMERLRERWDFKFAFHYFLIEADAMIPEFNSDTLNTNIKGWEFSLAVRIFPTVTAFGTYSITEREDYDLNGFGKPSRSDPDFSGGQSMRIRIGIYLDF
ncbi:MAG: putative porin [Planctomycetes bacterium]|nr:putative porin [Planctomycetota bacterium]